MPIYEYRCPACGNEFELMQSFSAEAQHECPKCGATAQRKISHSGFVLKGAGFYQNDYVRKPESPSGDTSPKADAAKSGDEKKSTDTAEAKPARPAASAKDSSES